MRPKPFCPKARGAIIPKRNDQHAQIIVSLSHACKLCCCTGHEKKSCLFMTDPVLGYWQSRQYKIHMALSPSMLKPEMEGLEIKNSSPEEVCNLKRISSSVASTRTAQRQLAYRHRTHRR